MSLPVTPRTDIAVRKTAYAIVFIALGVALSPFTSVPIGIAKINPTQHFLNVALATLLGPAWAFGGAGAMALIRNLLGTGTVLAFPGGMIGALFSGIAYRLTKSIPVAALAEVIGTGVFGSLAAALWVAPSFLGKTMSLLAMGASFGASSLAGAMIAMIALGNLKKAGLLPRFERDGQKGRE